MGLKEEDLDPDWYVAAAPQKDFRFEPGKYNVVNNALGTKYDADKLPMELLDPLALEGLAAVLKFGANKYSAHQWRGGFAWGRLLGALLRHSFAILRGEFTDPESGLPHIDHVGCCWMFLSNQMKTRPDLNDLYKYDHGSDANHGEHRS